MAIEEVYMKKVEEGYKDWYPSYWFSFIAMGRPIGDGNCSALFNSGLPTKIMSSGICPTASVMYGEGARDARKLEHRKMMEALATNESINNNAISGMSRKRKSSSVSSASSCNSTPLHEGPMKMQMIVQQKHAVQIFKDQIQVMIELGCASEEINEVRKRYLALLNSISATSSSSTSTTIMHASISKNIPEDLIGVDEYAEL